MANPLLDRKKRPTMIGVALELVRLSGEYNMVTQFKDAVIAAFQYWVWPTVANF